MRVESTSITLEPTICRTNQSERSPTNSSSNLTGTRYSDSKLKRSGDIVFGSLALLITIMVTIFVAPILLITSGRPVFFRQQRIGAHGKLFTLVKFRSMRSPKSGEDWALRTIDSDARITVVGKFLRHSYIDELPQFWNVLRGDMSIVGPRPELPALEQVLVDKNKVFRQRIVVKPGITGLAQVKYLHAHGEREAMRRLHFDRLYIQNSSLILDAKIVALTAVRMFRHRGT
jgi:lipopolysaccharide/colanic/teichoic acid biosynthesis glycosyltransferase